MNSFSCLKIILWDNLFYSATWKVHYSWVFPLIFPENIDVDTRLTELCEEVKVQGFFLCIKWNKWNSYKSRMCWLYMLLGNKWFVSGMTACMFFASTYFNSSSKEKLHLWCQNGTVDLEAWCVSGSCVTIYIMKLKL